MAAEVVVAVRVLAKELRVLFQRGGPPKHPENGVGRVILGPPERGSPRNLALVPEHFVQQLPLISDLQPLLRTQLER